MRLRELSDYSKDNNIDIVGASEEREKGDENLFVETVAEKCPIGGRNKHPHPGG